MKKIIFVVAIIALFGMQTVFAGQLGQNSGGIYYIQDDGTLAKSKWVTIDLDADGYEEYYYFNEFGFLVMNGKTPDGYDVNAKGQWVKDGIVQKKKKETPKSNYSGSSSYSSGSSYSNSFNDAYKSSMEAYNSGIEAGKDAFNAGLDAGKSAVDAGIDAVGNMFGGIFKGAANDYKKEYGKAVDEYKKEYDKALNDYTSEFNGIMNQYKNSLGNLGNFGSFGW